MKMKVICMAMLALIVLLLSGCSPHPTEGCWITHTNGVALDPQVQFPLNGVSLAMNPGDSYQIWCARNINNSTVGDIISEDRQTLRIASMPTEVEIYPNERDKVYLGHSVSSSANVWMSFEKASVKMDIADVVWSVLSFALGVVITLAIALFIQFRRGTMEAEDDTATPF